MIHMCPTLTSTQWLTEPHPINWWTTRLPYNYARPTTTAHQSLTGSISMTTSFLPQDKGTLLQQETTCFESAQTRCQTDSGILMAKFTLIGWTFHLTHTKENVKNFSYLPRTNHDRWTRYENRKWKDARYSDIQNQELNQQKLESCDSCQTNK